MKKTLVIHPTDPTTKVLEQIYLGKDWTVITTNVSKSTLYEAIMSHDRIIMLGHGAPSGLYGHGRLVIDSTYVYLLREKDLVCIWCNADKFVEKYELKGFYTGMIISEMEEAIMYSIPPTIEAVTESNDLFSGSVAKAIDLEPKEMCESVKKQYVLDSNDIINFNKQNIYYK